MLYMEDTSMEIMVGTESFGISVETGVSVII